MHLLEKSRSADITGNYVRNKVLCTLLTIGFKNSSSASDADSFLDTYDKVASSILSIANTNSGSVLFHSTEIIHIAFFAGDSALYHTNRALETALHIKQYLKSIEFDACFAIDVGVCVSMTSAGKFYESLVPNTAVINSTHANGDIMLSHMAQENLANVKVQTGLSVTTNGKQYHALHAISSSEPEPLIHFVGRQLELARLQFLVEAATKSAGPTCTVVGEAGVGKSTLLDKFLERRDLYKIRVTFSPGSSSVLYLLVSLVTQIMHNDGIDRTDTQAIDYIAAKFFVRDALGLDALNYIFGRSTHSQEWDLLEPSVKLYKAADLVLSLITSISTKYVCVVAIEDLHWATQQALHTIADMTHRLSQNRTLIICTSRSSEMLKDLHSKTAIHLLQFNRHEVHLLYHTLVPADKDSIQARTAIDRCDGNPFYIAETIKYINSSQFKPGSLSNTLQDVIIARVEALSHAEQQFLRLASVLGFEFSLKQICEIFSLEVTSQRYIAKSLTARGYLYRIGLEHRYTFSHELKQIAIYSAVLNSDKIEAHRAALRYYMEQDPTNVQAIGWHAFEAGKYDIAYDTNLTLYDLAIDNYNPTQAMEAISRCELIATPDPIKLSHLRIKRLRAQLLKGDAALLQKTLRELSRPTSVILPEQSVEEIQGASWLCQWMAADYKAAIQDITQAKKHITAGTELSITASIRLAGIYADIGEYAKSTDILDRLRQEIIAADPAEQVPHLAFPYRAALEAINARNDACLGMTDSALSRCLSATKYCAAQKSKVSQIFAMCYTAETYIICECFDLALPLVQEAASIVNKNAVDILYGYASVLHGYILSLRGDESALRLIRNGIESCLQRNQVSRVSLYYYYLTRALIALNHHDDAKDAISQAISLSTRYGENGVLLVSLQLAEQHKLLPDRMDVTKEIAALEVWQARMRI